MKIVFAKFHCEESDYLIANTPLPKNFCSLSVKICNRRVGAGADGVVFVQKIGKEYIAAQINPDGTHAILCDAALRCVTLYLHQQDVRAISFTIKDGTYSHTAKILSKDLLQTQINNISFSHEKIPALKLNHDVVDQLCEIHGEGIRLSAINCIIPYAVVFCHEINYINIGAKGGLFQNSRIFHNGVNVAFIQIVDYNCVKLKAYRAGCGQVPACGNGAVAAIYTAHYLGLCGTQVNAVFDNSAMEIKLQQDKAVILSNTHFIGNFELKE